jgi:hypothetical protein
MSGINIEGEDIFGVDYSRLLKEYAIFTVEVFPILLFLLKIDEI